VPNTAERDRLQPEGGIPSHPGVLDPVVQSHSDPFTQFVAPPAGPLSIEEAYARFLVLQGVSGPLKQFGYDFFRAEATDTSVAADAPVAPDYIIGPGDTLVLHVWNVPSSEFNQSYTLTVERDGTVYVPKAGSVPIAGVSFSDATQLIDSRLRKILKHFDMHLSVSQLRTMKVFVVGEVVHPGAYELTALASVSQALTVAAGVARSGSLRKIQVVRQGKPAGELDFYKFFLQGDRSQDLRLKPGDTVLVPPIGPVAAIAGPVKRPAIYEMLAPVTLTALIELAGGLSPTADRSRCQIFRIEPGRGRSALDVRGSDPAIQDGDLVQIAGTSTLLENTVSIQGAIRNPGAYPFRRGMHLGDLLTPGQVTADTWLDGAELVRTDPATYESKISSFNPRQLLRGDRRENIELQRLDKVVLMTQARSPVVVTVSGEVRRPGNYVVANQERLSSVLRRAGGLTERGFSEGLTLVRDSVRRTQQEEIAKFVSLQKQQLMAESASVTAGSSGLDRESASTEQMALQTQLNSLNELSARMHPGRVVIQAESLEKLAGSRDDLLLETNDQIIVPERPQTVTVLGAVRNPASFAFHERLTGRDYVDLAGGPTRYGRMDEAYVLRPNGSTLRSLRHLGVGDAIVIPERIQPKTRALPLVVALASILASMATTVAALVIIAVR
jgi:protein involved in polysaccharide export with SLBB domain